MTAETRRDYNREQKAAARARAREAGDADRIVSALHEVADRIVSANADTADRILSAVLSALSPGQTAYPPEILSATAPGAASPAPKGPGGGEAAIGDADTNGRGHADTRGRGHRCADCGRLAFSTPCEHCTPEAVPPPLDLRAALGERDLELPGRKDLA